jgi:TRAP-type transport system periplasmic protein
MCAGGAEKKGLVRPKEEVSVKPFLSAAGIAVIVAGLVGGGAAAPAQEFKWDMPNTFGRTSSDGVADLLFAKLVKEKTDGRIEITHHFDGSLGYSGVDHLTAVQDGAVPIARHAMSYYGGYDPMFLLSTLPFLVRDVSEVEIMHEVAGPAVEEAFLEFDQVVVSAGLFPPSGIWAKEEIESLEDLQGLKVRAFDLNSLETFSGAGAAAVNMNWGDVIPALSTGAIDAVVTSADLGNASGIYEYLPNFHEINWAVPLSTITINKDVWEALPEDLQEAVLEAGEETTRRTFERLRTQVSDNYTEMRAKDVNVVEDPPEQLVEALHDAAQPAIKRWRDTAGDRAAVLDEYLAAVGREE